MDFKSIFNLQNRNNFDNNIRRDFRDNNNSNNMGGGSQGFRGQNQNQNYSDSVN